MSHLKIRIKEHSNIIGHQRLKSIITFNSLMLIVKTLFIIILSNIIYNKNNIFLFKIPCHCDNLYNMSYNFTDLKDVNVLLL